MLVSAFPKLVRLQIYHVGAKEKKKKRKKRERKRKEEKTSNEIFGTKGKLTGANCALRFLVHENREENSRFGQVADGSTARRYDRQKSMAG